jgi:hypothetical protein
VQLVLAQDLLDLVEARAEGEPALTRIQSGFFSTSAGTTLIGMREVLACDFCLAVGS